jgi:glycosyltransferase involved in cell wall biosynthesis
VPLGVDSDAFTRDGPVHPLTAGVRCTFLFVGAAIERKGIDVLLRAYLDAFDDGDDVQLVVKDHTGDVFYEGLSQREGILEAARTPGAPRIQYLDAYLSRAELAALYRGATALVHPARAEGWALPVLEAMACGTPVVVPEFGPFLDYCTSPAAELVTVRRLRAPVQRDFTVNALGSREHVESIDFCEPDVAAVATALRAIASWSHSELQERRAAARAHAQHWTWARAAGVMVQAVRELAAR